jgi:hypothetical protein
MKYFSTVFMKLHFLVKHRGFMIVVFGAMEW